MKAIQYTGYGNTDVLQQNDIEKPVVKENEVLVRISATTINPLDMKIRSGIMKQIMPVTFPYTPGMDLSGTIEETGSNVTRLKIGDQVYAATTSGGTYAQYISIDANLVAKVPHNITLNEAAALTIPLVTAYTFLIKEARVQAGQKILIQGAAGGVGQVILQMGKALGLYVIGTASGKGTGLLESLGANEVIDYKNQDFSQLVKDADIVIDLVGGETQKKSFTVLKKGGLLLSTVMPPDDNLAQKYGVSARFADGQPSFQILEFGTDLIQQGKIKPNVSKVMTLEEAATAQNLVSAGGLNGKVVLTVN
jgi:NADPH:quinone reductase-like Zn-dependent oxidoreductase